MMDGDPAVEPELDTFSLVLPLPYRIAVIFIAGMISVTEHARYLANDSWQVYGPGA